MRFTAAFLVLLGLTTAAPTTSSLDPSLDPDFTPDIASSLHPPTTFNLPTTTITDTGFDAALSLLPANATAAEISTIFKAADLVCGTYSKWNPSVRNIHIAANELIAALGSGDAVCWQTESVPCRTYEIYSTAHIATCGPQGKGVKCSTLAWAAKHIANNCAWAGKAKGHYNFVEAGVMAVVY